MLAAGIALAVLAGPIGVSLFASIAVTNMMIGVGLTTALGAGLGLLAGTPQDPSNIGSQGQLPIEIPNPLWRIVYGLFQFAGAITFEDGPVLDWIGTGNNLPCNNQYIHRVHTLTCHQIAGFLSVVIDGQTFNFGTDLVLLTTANNNGGRFGPAGMWAFISLGNPWTGVILFEFDCGDPGNPAQPFPFLLAGSSVTGDGQVTGSSRWTPACLQQGRAKVHVLIHYVPANQGLFGPQSGAPQSYPLGSGRIPTVEFKIAGRIILDPRIVTAWQADTSYPQYSYVLLTTVGPPSIQEIWVQQNASGVSGATAPNFAGAGLIGTVTDGSCLWARTSAPHFAAGSGQTALNNPASMKLGGPGGSTLIADAWQGGTNYLNTQVIEAPIGWLQQAEAGLFTGAQRPNFATALGAETPDNTGTWRCLGRSPYATCLPDDDDTQNQGGLSNPALVIADFLQTPRNQFGLGTALTADSIETVVAAANICDEPQVIEVFADSTSLSERSYACNGCFESTSAYGDVLKSLALSMAGFAVPPGDCWRIYAGSYIPPEITLTDSDARDSIKGDFRLSARDTCNGVKGQYIPAFLPINIFGPLASSPASPAWKKTDFPPVQSAAYIAEDGGIILWKDITLDFTISLWMAQRIAKIVMERLRRQITISDPVKLSGLQIGAGDTVTVVHPRWESVCPPMPDVFQVSHTTLRLEKGSAAPVLGVDLVLRQTDAAVFEFTPPSSPTEYGDYSPYGQTGIGAGNVE